jgi:hypothetical protein
MWHYFVNDIYFAEYGEESLTPYTVTINVKEKNDGDFVYSFSAEKAKEPSTRQTLHAGVNTYQGANGELFLDNSISDSAEKVNRNSEKISYSRKTHTPSPEEAKRNLAENAREVLRMSSVSKLSGKEFEADGNGTLKDRVVTFFQSFGNQVHNEQLGTVAVTQSSFRDDKVHGLTFNKVVSFAAIPEVISNGKVIDVWKPEGKPYTRITLAAPIEIAGEKYYMGVMIQKDHHLFLMNYPPIFSTQSRKPGLTNK